MKVALTWAVLLCTLSAVLCYRAPQHVPSGSYSLPKIGNYPAPTVFNPRNHGLPSSYKNFRFSRSVDDQFATEHEQPALDEVLRQTRSADEFDAEETLFEDEQAEQLRQRRSPKFIFPTYRPPRKGPPRIYRI